MTDVQRQEERIHPNQNDRERSVKHKENMTMEELETKMRQHADRMIKHHSQVQRAMYSIQLNEIERQ